MEVTANTLISGCIAVLDTQAVLDWLYFNDPVTAGWEAARRAGRWRWVAAREMRDELAHVLQRGQRGGRGLPSPRSGQAPAAAECGHPVAGYSHHPPSGSQPAWGGPALAECGHPVAGYSRHPPSGSQPAWGGPALAEAVLAAMDACAAWQPLPPPDATGRLRCTDPDDQKFIDAAVAWGARWLVSRDRAVLKLRRRAAEAHGLLIVPPRAWRTPPVD
jgi:hypothetical protein